ncbi:MAG TPA: response regulator [Dehalococcoidia bacterium]|nr:response regulator [Dehalococcoidia bacterium]
MDTHVIAAEVAAELGSLPERRLPLSDLCARLERPLSEVAAACEVLRSCGIVASCDGGVPALAARGERRGSRLVLIAENSAAVAHVLAALLEGEGYGVLIARTLGLAEGVLRATSVDLVIADSFAATAAAALTRLAALRDLARPAPVLLFTGHRDVPELAARAAGYAGMLPKPFDIDELLARVGAAINGRAPA